jgi:hypothetical protein
MTHGLGWFLFALLLFIIDCTYEYHRHKAGKSFLKLNATVDERTFNLISQLGHFAGGLAVVFGSYSFWGWHGALISILVLAGLVAIKEFWWDNKYESVEVRGSNFLDWSMWMVGAAVALVLVFIRRKYF